MRRLTPDELTGLVRAAAAVAGQPDLDAVLRTTVETARDASGARYAALGVVGEHGTLSEFLHSGIDRETAERIGRLPTGRGVLGTLMREGETVIVDHINSHPDSVGFPPHHPPMDGFLGVPIRMGDTVFGNLYLTDKPGGFTPEDATMVEGLAAIAGAAVSTARLRDRVTRLALVEDRERIARDLHDAVIQDLFAVGLELQSMAMNLEPPHAAQLTDAVDRIDQAIGSLRAFVFDLRTLTEAHTDPARAVRQLVRRLAAPYGTEIEVTSDADLGRLPADRLDDTLQIAREATSNALRHSGTDRVEIDLERARGSLILIVRDRGSGFDPGAVTAGLGLANMRERADRVGGTLLIDSEIGEGTEVRAEIPI